MKLWEYLKSLFHSSKQKQNAIIITALCLPERPQNKLFPFWTEANNVLTDQIAPQLGAYPRICLDGLEIALLPEGVLEKVPSMYHDTFDKIYNDFLIWVFQEVIVNVDEFLLPFIGEPANESTFYRIRQAMGAKVEAYNIYHTIRYQDKFLQFMGVI